MGEQRIYHALGLHLHQPPGNMLEVLKNADYEAVGIIHAYDRISRYAMDFKDAKFHVGMSGVLLDQLLDPEVIDAYAPHLDINAMLERYRKAENIELMGMGHFHPVFPLIPQKDWEEQLSIGREKIKKVFGREPLGFWPSEMAFTMEMIPAIVKAGYKYLVVDSYHLRPYTVDASSGRADVLSAYVAEYDGIKIDVVPRNRDVSNAQESGMDATWFRNEVLRKVRENPNPDKPRMVCTWSDGENGGWFRQMHEPSGFWGHFFAPFMEQVRSGGEITPVKISEYLEMYPPVDKTDIQTGAWNVASTSGSDFSQWNGSSVQKQGVSEIGTVSDLYWMLKPKVDDRNEEQLKEKLQEARDLILESETSCFLFWGDDWVPRLYERTEPARAILTEISKELS